MRTFVLLACLLPLTGCIGGDADPSIGLIIDERGAHCQVTSCSVKRLFSGGYEVNVKVSSAQTGVVINADAVELYISGDIVGGIVGIRADCNRCSITLSSLDLMADDIGAVLNVPDGHLSLENVTISTLGGGTSEVPNPPTRFDASEVAVRNGGSTGVLITGAANVKVDGLAVRATMESAGTAISAISDQFEAANVSVELYDIAMELDARDVLQVRGTKIQCERIGIQITGELVAVRDARIHGCVSRALSILGANRFVADGIEVTDSRVGIFLMEGNEVAISNFTLSSNDYGMLVFGDQTTRQVARISRGVVEQNRYVGLEAKWHEAVVRDVVFHGNGHDWPDKRDVGESYWYGGFVYRGPRTLDSHARVVESSFSENQPYSLANVAYSQVDATQNWWGSPVGPVLSLEPVGAPGIEEVYGPVLTEPHLTAPP